MNDTNPQPDPASDLHRSARDLLELHWLDHGYTMPNRDTYPWQWLWDSCFHAIVWCGLGDDRAVVELERLFTHQADSGFVPHMNYLPDPEASVAFWGRRGSSTITQPPMFGHAIAELERRGMTVPGAMVEAAERGLRFLLGDRRRSAAGLIELCHPWETGCDDSPRWDGALDRPWSAETWKQHKWKLVASVQTDRDGGAIANDDFAVGSIGFNALVAFNARELAAVNGSDHLRTGADELSAIIESRWLPEAGTWGDDGALADTSGTARTLGGHLALLVVDDTAQLRQGMDDLVDPGAFGAPFGPAGVHRAEPSFDPDTYWRGPAWPQMSYLMWVAARRAGDRSTAADIAESLRRGAVASGWAEYWNPDTGAGRGAIPQSWAALAAIVQ